MEKQIKLIESLELKSNLFYAPTSLALADYDYYILGLKSDNQIEKEDRINDIYHDFSFKIKTFILKNSGTVEDAKNIFQESLMALVYKTTSQNNFTLTAQLGTYLQTMWRNLWFNELKKSNRRPTSTLEDSSVYSEEIEDTIDNSATINLYNSLKGLVESELLTDNQKKLLKLILQGFTNKEIAQIQNKTEIAVAQAKRKLFLKLKILIPNLEEYKHHYQNWKEQ